MNMTLAKTTLTDRFTEFAPLSTAAADYDIVRRAIAHIRGGGDLLRKRSGHYL